MADRRRIVFLGHEATRTGAPVTLLHLLRWLKQNTDDELELVVVDRVVLVGPESGRALLDGYGQVVTTRLLWDEPMERDLYRKMHLLGRTRQLSKFVRARRLTEYGGRLETRIEKLAMEELSRIIGPADLLYINTIDASRWWLERNEALPPSILHIHEMATGLRVNMDMVSRRLRISEREVISRAVQLSRAIVVPSIAAQAELLELAPEAAPHTRVVHEAVDVSALRRCVGEADGLRESLGIRPGERVVMSCGTIGSRKGTDLFVQIAAAFRSLGIEGVRFVWVGFPLDDSVLFREQLDFDLDVKRAGVGGIVTTVPSVPNAGPYLAFADVFLLPSREDPFPLVAIEAAALGKPVVCFRSSGIAELIDPGAGFVVPHLDVAGMVRSVKQLLDDQALREDMGSLAARRAETCDIEVIGPQLLGVIEGVLGGG